MNIPNKLKNKIINHELVTEEETNLFLKYIINKILLVPIENQVKYSELLLLLLPKMHHTLLMPP